MGQRTRQARAADASGCDGFTSGETEDDEIGVALAKEAWDYDDLYETHSAGEVELVTDGRAREGGCDATAQFQICKK